MNQVSRRNSRRKLISEINVVPYIDVTLVLLIIFMITAPLEKKAVDVNLPISGGAKIELKSLQLQVIVSIQKEGQLYLSDKEQIDKPISLAKLLSHISALYKKSPEMQVYIKGDKSVNYGQVVSIMAALKEAGVSHVGLMTRSLEP